MDLLADLQFSHYAARALTAHPDDRAWLAEALASPFDWARESSGVVRAASGDDPVALGGALRNLRRRAFLHTMARDLTRRADLREVCSVMTRLAELALEVAVEFHHRALAARHGTPRSVAGDAQSMIVIGMGKLGGGELNVSSDVDLVFVYPEEGETDGHRTVSAREFFESLGRRVIAALHEVTGDGYVFRVDMRLRPYGESGPLAVPLSALEQYLITQGRAWERYAWLKARPLTGDAHEALAAIVTPFVFRKYLDFDAYEGLRDIHRQIREQGKRRDYAANVKLGPGGIREVEFTVQAIQLVRGGREPGLQVRGTLPALDAISARKLLPEAATTALRDAYVFLRDVEHRLQYRDDQQTQLLPEPPAERAALAAAMHCTDVAAFEAMLEAQRRAVDTHFAAIFGGPEPDGGDDSVAGDDTHGTNRRATFTSIWREEFSHEPARSALATAGFDDPDALLALLARVRTSGRYLQLPALSRDRFDALLPQLLEAASCPDGPTGSAQTVFVRLLALLETVSRRSAYLALLVEHPPLLPRLAELMAASAWAADYLTRHPLLLDELLDARVLLAEVDGSAWRQELDRMLADRAGDAERQMDALRHFQHAQSFRLLAQDLAGLLTVERLADHLSALADIIIAAALREVWRLVAGVDAAPPRFAVVGYGKLGGKELGYASDLDLVFLYDDPADGKVELYTRLARRLVTWLTSTTAGGALYETDLRLRPDGASGLVVTSIRSFVRYQQDHAWTWEHQALTRARFVAGDATLGNQLESERERILRLPRDSAKLLDEVVEMRRKLHDGHPNPTALFDLKHDSGGMVDVEFAVQYLVLAHAHRHPALTRNVGNIALLGIAADLVLIPVPAAGAAADAYRHYRRRQHQLRLTGVGEARVPREDEADHRAAVGTLWHTVFGASWHELR
ncbi:MAG: bifunctional [glutamate--ammonia ligase]-adenylyl-L-tyrosine phosphorylase/[glutamate--ammonia-ligase] adenylyltransferase [Casimicrobiaceae bacterium]